MTRKQLTVAMLIAIVLALIVGSFLPFGAKAWLGTNARYVSIPVAGTHLHFNEHRAVHMAMFGITAWLLISMASLRTGRILAAAAVCLLAVLVEAGEVALYHNAMEWLDVRDDIIGVAAAFLLTRPQRFQSETASPAASEK